MTSIIVIPTEGRFARSWLPFAGLPRGVGSCVCRLDLSTSRKERGREYKHGREEACIIISFFQEKKKNEKKLPLSLPVSTPFP